MGMRKQMDANMQDLYSKMDASAQSIRSDMQTLRGEMQSMGLGQQTSLDGMKGIMAVARDKTRTTEHKMAAPHGRTNEPRSVEICRPAMETGEVGTRDAVTIIRETCRTRHEEVIEKLTVPKTRIIK